jgi:hypothetical protein
LFEIEPFDFLELFETLLIQKDIARIGKNRLPIVSLGRGRDRGEGENITVEIVTSQLEGEIAVIENEARGHRVMGQNYQQLNLMLFS